eukprot:jgi/Bigna1/141077/aug1.60_g15785
MDSAHEEYSMPLSDVISTAEPSFGSIRLAGEGEGDSKYSIPQTLSDLSQINIDDGSIPLKSTNRPERKEMLQPNTQIRCRVSEKKIANDGKPLVTLDFSQQPENAPRMFIKRRTPVVESRNSSEKLIAYVDIEISSNRVRSRRNMI